MNTTGIKNINDVYKRKKHSEPAPLAGNYIIFTTQLSLRRYTILRFEQQILF